jgi:hypothetical protein
VTVLPGGSDRDPCNAANTAQNQRIAVGGNLRLGVAWIGGFPPVSLSVTDEVGVDGD